MHFGAGSNFARVMMAVITTISITIVACGGPGTPPPVGNDGPPFVINSPQDGSLTAGTFFFSVQPLDASSVSRVEFEVDGAAVGSDSTADDGYRFAISASDYAAGEIELQATVVGTNGRSRSASVTVENVPNPPSSTTVGTDGAVLATARGSTLGIRPGDAVGANVTFAERTQAEVKAASGVDYAALGVTFLGAQEIDSDSAVEQPLMVSSADFASFVQPGQAIVNYLIVPDADGDGIGELVVMNSASVAGDDVISDPVPALQLGDATVVGQGGSARFSPQQQGIAGQPGDLVEVEASGFNPVASQSNRVLWTSLVDDTVMEGIATVSGSAPQVLTFGIPALPPGAATMTLSNLSNGTALAPIDVTIQSATTIRAVPQQAGSAEQIIDQFLQQSLQFLQGLPAGTSDSAEAKARLLQRLADLEQELASVFAYLDANPTPEVEALFDGVAQMLQNPPDFSVIDLPLSSQALTEAQKKQINWIKIGFGGVGTALGVAAVFVGCGIAAALCAAAVAAGAVVWLLDLYLAVEDERPGCEPFLGSGLGDALGLTGMGSAPDSGGSGCGGASGGGSASSLRGQQVTTDPILIRILVGGSPLPFTGVADAAGYFYIPLIPAGETFTAVATDTGSNEVRTVEGIGPALGESVYLFFDFASNEGALPTIPLNSNVTNPIAPGDSDLFVFVGSAGQLVTLGGQGDPAFSNTFSFDLFDPGSNAIIERGTGKFYNESVVVALPTSGLYTLSISSSSGTGSYNVGLSEIDAPTPIAIGTSPATVTGQQTVYGDRHFFSFDAVAGDLHKFSLTLPAGSEFNAWLNLRGPGPDPFYEGPDLLTPTVSVTSSTSTGGVSVSDPFLVPVSGTYVLEVERGNSSTTIETSLGAWEFAVLTPDPASAIAIGDTVNGAIGDPGEIDLYTFTATVGQMVDFSTANLDAEVDQVNWSLSAPDGSVLFDEPLFMDPGNFTLTDPGTYTLLVGSDADDGTGAYEFTLLNVP